MQLAGMKSSTADNLGIAPPAAAAAVAVTATTEASAPTSSLPLLKSQPQNQKPTQVIVSNLPIARKASLHRFLEKRKDRISAKAPYQVKDSPANSAKAAAESQPWLGLNPSLSSRNTP
ncbi:pnFL-2 [Iris pallida]|uniref:PnFL-2 n=1 Tax=Iris pallida TaxID=29817 RepID=A0AAX6HWV7_IRIPA|nr:pnFL-2 [Iris pallida]